MIRPRLALALFVVLATGCAEQAIEPSQVIARKGHAALLGTSSPALSSSLDPAARFTYLPLPFSVAFAINDAGLVVGAASDKAAIWTASGGFVVLGNADGSTVCCSYFKGVNTHGDVVGATGNDPNWGIAVQLWSQSTNARTVLGPGVGFGINDNGDVVGHSDPFYIPNGGRPMQLPKGSLFIHGYIGEGRPINNARSIVGYLWGPDGLSHAVVWPDPAGPVVDLGSLGGDQAQANSIDNAGDIVGWGEVAHGSAVRHAVLWPATGGMIDLTSWPNPCAGSSEANGANDQGFIVGTCNGQPVLWTAAQGMRLLSLPADPGNGQKPFAVNSHFQIAGTGGIWQLQASQTINFGPLSGKTFGDPDFTVSAVASSGLAVTFSATGSCTVIGTTVHLTGGGGCSITADQAGNASYPAAPSVPQSFSIAPASQAISFTSSAPGGAVDGGATYVVTATGGASGNPVTFGSSTPGVCMVSGSTVSFSGVGTCTVTADQAANSNYAAAPQAAQSFAVGLASQSITFGALSGRTFGDADFAVSATASSGLAVSFTASGACTVSGTTVHLTSGGSCSITATQAGNGTYAAAPSVPRSFTVVPEAQTITFTSSAPIGAVYHGASYLVTATGGGSGNPVLFGSATTSVCTVSGNTVSFVGVGTCTVTADEAGTASYSTAFQATQSFAVGQSSQTISFGALAGATYGDPSLGVGATASSGLAVTFTASGNCSLAGSAVSPTGAGSCTITAHQSGNTNYAAAPDAAQSFAIAQATPVIAWTPPTSMFLGTALSAVQLNATATGVGGAALAGTFGYTPPAGTLLPAGPAQLLSVSFTPFDATNYVGASKTVSIAVVYALAVRTDQCKDTGWQIVHRANGTLFKNQGDCIQYVNTGN